MAEIPGGSVEVPSREILVATGSLFIDVAGEMTYVVLDPNRAKRIYAARWQLDMPTEEYYWISSLAELFAPRNVGSVIDVISLQKVIDAGNRGAARANGKLSGSDLFELKAAEHKGQISYTVR